MGKLNAIYNGVFSKLMIVFATGHAGLTRTDNKVKGFEEPD